MFHSKWNDQVSKYQQEASPLASCSSADAYTDQLPDHTSNNGKVFRKKDYDFYWNDLSTGEELFEKDRGRKKERKRLDKILEKLDGFESRLDKIDKRLDRIEENQKALDKIEGIERQISERWERPAEQPGSFSDMLETNSKRFGMNTCIN